MVQFSHLFMTTGQYLKKYSNTVAGNQELAGMFISHPWKSATWSHMQRTYYIYQITINEARVAFVIINASTTF